MQLFEIDHKNKSTFKDLKFYWQKDVISVQESYT